MGILRIKELVPGMILEREVRDAKGRVLLGEGATVVESHLAILRRFGINQVRVRGHGAEPTSLDAAALRAIEQATRLRFRHADLDHCALKVLFHSVCARLVYKRTETLERG
jgi:molybdopterin biosynthesis enzyme